MLLVMDNRCSKEESSKYKKRYHHFLKAIKIIRNNPLITNTTNKNKYVWNIVRNTLNLHTCKSNIKLKER